MPADFDRAAHALRKLRVGNYRGLVFATFSDDGEAIANYIGPVMAGLINRIFHKLVEDLVCTRQCSNFNWNLHLENLKEPDHASLPHPFHTTVNSFRIGMKTHCVGDGRGGIHSIIMAIKQDQGDTSAACSDQKIRSYDSGFVLQDDSVLALIAGYEVVATNHIQPIFPQLVIQQIHNSLVARQLLPRGVAH